MAHHVYLYQSVWMNEREGGRKGEEERREEEMWEGKGGKGK